MTFGKSAALLLSGASAFVLAATASAQVGSGQATTTQSDASVGTPTPSTNGPAETAGAATPQTQNQASGPDAAASTSGAPVPQTDSANPAQTSSAPADIVVTGSRVLRNGAASPTPLTTVSAQLLDVAAPAGTLSDGLNNLPVFSGSRSQFSNAGANATGVQGGNGNANVLNLRNLGANRTLVLFDGHRIPPTLFNSTVDVDLIPQELIERVDIVTGGVSAVYGSDAVSGVVNFIPNRHFNGVSGHAEAGISERGDNGTRDIGLAAGTDLFGGRGHIEASYEHRDNDGILDRVGTRSWLNLAAVEGAGTAANPYHLVTNVHLSQYTFGGLITNGALAGQQFAQNGVLSPFIAGAPTGTTAAQIGGSGAYQDASMVAPLSSNQGYVRGDFDVTDSIHFYVTGAINSKTNTSYTGWNTLANYTFNTSNAFLPAGTTARFGTATSFNLSEILSNAPRTQAVADTNQYYVNTGLEGKLGRFKWEVAYSHGTSKLDLHLNNIFNQQNLAAALDAVNVGGTIQCYAATQAATAAAYAGCVPLNVFGPTAGSQQALNYVLTSAEFRTRTAQDSVDAAIHGDLFDDWAGPVSVALSGEWRRQTFSANSDALPSTFANCAGLRYNCTANTTLYSTTYPYSPTVGQSVKEGAAEIEVPLLRDFAIAKAIDLNAAGRYTDYSTSGHYWTWKVGGTWDVDGQFKLRSTISHDIRAPTLYDLYQPTTTVNGNFSDTLNTYVNGGSSRTVYVPSINVGNPNLTAESAYTFTIGGVFQPRFIPGLTITVDHYRTVIKNAITTVQGFNAAIQTACYQSGGTSPYCALIIRPGAATDASAGNVATAFLIQPQNIARQRTYGVDVEADYRRELWNRPLGLRFLLNWQPHIYYEQPGIVTIDQGGAGWGTNGLMPAPAVAISGFANYNILQNLRADVFVRYRGPFRRSGVPTQVFSDPTVPSFTTTNLTLTWNIPSPRPANAMAVHFSVTNIFDTKPPLSGYYSGATSAGQAYEFSDDPTGRAFYAGVRFKF